MTINIEQRAVLLVCGPNPSDPATFDKNESETQCDDCELCSSPKLQVQPERSIPLEQPTRGVSSTSSSSSLPINDDEVSMASTSSSSSSCSSRRIRWADSLVTKVSTRPRTPPCEVPLLFYSYEDTQRFRAEARSARKFNFTDEPTVPSSSSSVSGLWSSKSVSRHRISRVVVNYLDQMETLYDTTTTTPSPMTETISNNEGSCDDFFDSDSFWSGSITWY